jgi:uncharacterized protein (DUF924 family)
MSWQDEVIAFWFSLDPAQWWKTDPELDETIRLCFERLWHQQRALEPQSFLQCADDALAAAILFDQFPRNMFRGHADQFSTDPLALAIARGAVDARLDQDLDARERTFLYMPFQHSEDRADQSRSVLLFTALGDQDQLRFARLHHDVIERFGRFPHRNAQLGRPPRPDEVAAGDVVPW